MQCPKQGHLRDNSVICRHLIRRLIATTAVAVLLAGPALAQVSQEAHEKCLNAQDYKGCIEILGAVIKNQINPSTRNIKLNIDTQVVADGNPVSRRV